MTSREEYQQQYQQKGYTKAEVDILVNIARLSENIKAIEENYVRRDEFAPVAKLVYGLVAIIMIAVVGAILSLIIVSTIP